MRGQRKGGSRKDRVPAIRAAVAGRRLGEPVVGRKASRSGWAPRRCLAAGAGVGRRALQEHGWRK